MEQAIEILGYAREILPVWLQATLITLTLMSMVGFGYAAYRMFINPPAARNDEHEEIANVATDREPCRYCREPHRYRDDLYYMEWEEYINDLKDPLVCVPHVLKRARFGIPARGLSPDEEIERRIDAELARMKENGGITSYSAQAGCHPQTYSKKSPICLFCKRFTDGAL